MKTNNSQNHSRRITPASAGIMKRIASKDNWIFRRRPVLMIAGTTILIAGLLLWIGLAGQAERRAKEADIGLTAEVRRGPLTISLVESGAIRNRERVIVRSEVEGTRAIIHLVPEGTMVKTGDLLVELDSSSLEEQRLEQTARVDNSDAALIQSGENLEVVRNQAAADVAKAELDLRFAVLALEQYENGEYPQQLQQAEAAITIAGEELQRARDHLEWSRTLKTDGYITRSELEADVLALKRRELDLEQAIGKRDLLTKYTHVQKMEELRSDIQQKEMALERVQRRAKADTIKAEADFRSKEADLLHQQNRLSKLEDQIKKCRITAPVDGMVVYATSAQTRRWWGDPLESGQSVRERQELIHLPTDEEMMAEFTVQEASLPKLKLGLPARITLESDPNIFFNGELTRIGVMPDTRSMGMNPDLKLYNCEANINDRTTGLRQGMSCTVELIIEQHDDALYFPLQALVRLDGEPTVYVAGSRGIEARRVRVGLDNGRMVHVLEGVEEGERILLTPPLASSIRHGHDGPQENEKAPDTERLEAGQDTPPAKTPEAVERKRGEQPGEDGRQRRRDGAPRGTQGGPAQ